MKSFAVIAFNLAVMAGGLFVSEVARDPLLGYGLGFVVGIITVYCAKLYAMWGR